MRDLYSALWTETYHNDTFRLLYSTTTPRASASRQSKPRLVEFTSSVSRDNLINGSAYAANELQTEMLAIAQSVWAQRPTDDR